VGFGTEGLPRGLSRRWAEGSTILGGGSKTASEGKLASGGLMLCPARLRAALHIWLCWRAHHVWVVSITLLLRDAKLMVWMGLAHVQLLALILVVGLIDG